MLEKKPKTPVNIISMDDREEYYLQLEEALAKKAKSLEKTEIRQLRDHFAAFESSVSTIYNFLLEKGQIQPDPYKNEYSATEIKVPSSALFKDKDAIQEISLRLSKYVSQWEYLVNLFHVSIINLDLKKIKLILELLEYIRWTDFSVNSTYFITKTTAEIVNRAAKRNGQLAERILTNSVSHLRELTVKIHHTLKILTDFLKEDYKFKVRKEVLSEMDINSEQYLKHPDTVIENLKFEFSHLMKGQGWYKELIHEMLEEDFGENRESRRELVLKKLEVKENKKVKKKTRGPDNKTILLGILGKIARAGDPVRDTILKMNNNAKVLQEQKKTLAERFSEILKSLFNKKETALYIKLGMKDALTGATRYETINYFRFSDSVVKKARTLIQLQDTSGSLYEKTKTATEEQLMEFIQRQINELKTIYRRLEGLNAYFLSDEIPEESRTLMKNTAMNIKSFKYILGDSLKAFNEFKIKKQEEEQLKKLGIED